MINADQLRQLTARADQGYLALFLLGLLVAWLLFVLWHVAPLGALARWFRAPLPMLTLPMILIVGLIVRLPHLFDSFWYDETFTARMASLPLSHLPGAILGDVHPPLWYAIEWITARLLGTSEFALRLPSLGFGVLLIYLVDRMALELGVGQKVALLSAFLVALLPTAAYYSAEARCYSLLACLAVTLVMAAASDRRALFALAGMLMVWTHNLGVFYLLILSPLPLLDVWRVHTLFPAAARRYTLRWGKALLVAWIGAGVWLPFLYTQSQRVAGGFWIDELTPGGVLRYLTDETIGRRIPEAGVLPVYVGMFVLIALALVGSRRWLKSRRGLLYLALVIGVPLAVALASVVWRPVYLTRALLPCGVALVVVWAYLLVHSPARHALRWLSAAVVGGALISFYMPSVSRTDIRAMFHDCRGATSAYATSIPAAMFSAYYAGVPLTTWTDAGDLNQSLTPDAKAAFLLTSADQPPAGDVCLLALDTPMTTDAERAEIERLKARYAYTVRTPSVDELLVVHLYRFQVNERTSDHVVARIP